MTGLPVQTIDRDGRRLAYRRTGSGPLVLLLHGAFVDGRSWQRQMTGLPGRTVVAWDAPGCGASSDPPPQASLADYADDAARLVAALGLGAAHLVGLSFGSGLALEVARRHPGQVASLVLASPYAGWAGSLPEDEVRARRAAAVRNARRPPEEWLPELLPGMFSPTAPDAAIAGMAALMRESRPGPTLTMVEAFAEADLRDVLPQVHVPTLIIHGSQDVRAPWPVVQAIHEQIPGSRLAVLDGVGHACSQEAPAAFTALVRGFLDDLMTRPS